MPLTAEIMEDELHLDDERPVFFYPLDVSKKDISLGIFGGSSKNVSAPFFLCTRAGDVVAVWCTHSSIYKDGIRGKHAPKGLRVSVTIIFENIAFDRSLDVLQDLVVRMFLLSEKGQRNPQQEAEEDGIQPPTGKQCSPMDPKVP